MSDNEADAREQRRKESVIRQALDALESEGFDSITLLVTHMDEHGNTCSHRVTKGNWFAATEMMRSEIRRREHTDLYGDDGDGE